VAWPRLPSRECNSSCFLHGFDCEVLLRSVRSLVFAVGDSSNYIKGCHPQKITPNAIRSSLFESAHLSSCQIVTSDGSSSATIVRQSAINLPAGLDRLPSVVLNVERLCVSLLRSSGHCDVLARSSSSSYIC
jgi:hypothetical protein